MINKTTEQAVKVIKWLMTENYTWQQIVDIMENKIALDMMELSDEDVIKEVHYFSKMMIRIYN